MISALVLLFVLQKSRDNIERYIYSVILWTTICFFMTQILSNLHAINRVNLWITWGVADVFLFLLFLITKRYKLIRKFSVREIFSFFKDNILWFIFAFVVILIAIKTVPYNWDSMTYHMSRVVHWFENGSVEHYATHINRQIGSPTLGAYINLHIYAMMNGSDRLVNLTQCISFLTNGIFVYQLAKKIGCTKKYCIMAMVLLYTMPIAFAEAFTTQVDNFSTIWLLSFVYLLLDLLNKEKKLEINRDTVFRVCTLSLCIAYGILAKPSVGFGFLFFCIWLLLVVIYRRDKIGIILAYIAMATCILLAVFSLDFGRNIKTFGGLLPSNVGQKQLVGTIKPNYLLMNGIKTFSFNLPSVWVYDSPDIIRNFNSKVADVLHVDINDESISEGGRVYSVNDIRDYGHDTAVNPVIVWLFLFSIYTFFSTNRKKGMQNIKNIFWVTSAAAFLVFCISLRWEPFVSRYMISYLALICVAVSGQMQLYFTECESVEKYKEGKLILFLSFLCITEAFGLFVYHGDIAIKSSRNSGYFVNRQDIESNYRNIVDIVEEKDYDSLGFVFGADVYEYPLLVMLKDDIKIKHVNVENTTNQYEDTTFIPEAILMIEYGEAERLMCHDVEYQTVNHLGDSIYLLERMD